MLVGERDGTHTEVDPDSLPLPAGLAAALHEWAQVVAAVRCDDRNHRPGGVTCELVSRRGRQLAGRLAAAVGAPVRYADPVRGELEQVEAPRSVSETAVATEPTPWATGLTVTLVTGVIVTCSAVVLSLGLADAAWWLAVLANLVIAGGLAPSVWIARHTPVWRWLAYGVMAGIGTAWFGLLLRLLF
ncbi:hypothetical protein GCM10012275_51940 [Longimycelium tulufanense]|uniref:DUF2537 domain-containing protein n=1 Tax=Longimycelium tulufanense TaxID=907463 RepID=A0A8J3CCR2_9PSEU|nr:hypothetical protein GCM10012275_51940 [Longimycelium tulufanense]